MKQQPSTLENSGQVKLKHRGLVIMLFSSVMASLHAEETQAGLTTARFSYPDHSCGAKPGKPEKPGSVNSFNNIKAYNKAIANYNLKVNNYNDVVKEYKKCINTYINTGNKNINHIRKKLNNALKEARAKD